MATKNLGPAGQCMCKHLRSKEMFHEETPSHNGLYSSGLFWCVHTNEGIGDDGECCDAQECTPGRSCFEE